MLPWNIYIESPMQFVSKYVCTLYACTWVTTFAPADQIRSLSDVCGITYGKVMTKRRLTKAERLARNAPVLWPSYFVMAWPTYQISIFILNRWTLDFHTPFFNPPFPFWQDNWPVMTELLCYDSANRPVRTSRAVTGRSHAGVRGHGLPHRGRPGRDSRARNILSPSCAGHPFL